MQTLSVAESSWLPLSVLPTQCRTDSVPVFVEKSADAILSTSGVEEDRCERYFIKLARNLLFVFQKKS